MSASDFTSHGDNRHTFSLIRHTVPVRSSFQSFSLLYIHSRKVEIHLIKYKYTARDTRKRGDAFKYEYVRVAVFTLCDTSSTGVWVSVSIVCPGSFSTLCGLPDKRWGLLWVIALLSYSVPAQGDEPCFKTIVSLYVSRPVKASRVKKGSRLI